MLKGKCWVKGTVAWKTMTCSFLRSLEDVVDVRQRPCVEETVSHLYDTVKSFQISDENFPSVRVVTRLWNFFNVTFYLNFYCAIPDGLGKKMFCSYDVDWLMRKFISVIACYFSHPLLLDPRPAKLIWLEVRINQWISISLMHSLFPHSTSLVD